MRPPVCDIDPYTPEYFEDPFPAHQELRELGSVVRLNRYDCWAVARYAEVHAVLSDWRTFSSARGAGLADFKKETPWRPPSLLLEADPPLHDRTRGVLDRVLSPAAVRGLRARLAKAAEALVAELLERGAFDAVADLAEAYPLKVFPDAMGVKGDGREYLLPYGNVVFNAFGPRNAFLAEAMRDAAPVIAWIASQCRREALSADGFGAAVYAAADRGEIAEEEAPLVVRSLLSAGVDTTVGAIGAAIHCLARFPEEFERLRANPALARAAFEEAVRFESPVQTFFRTTTRAVELGGVSLGEGE